MDMAAFAAYTRSIAFYSAIQMAQAPWLTCLCATCHVVISAYLKRGRRASEVSGCEPFPIPGSALLASLRIQMRRPATRGHCLILNVGVIGCPATIVSCVQKGAAPVRLLCVPMCVAVARLAWKLVPPAIVGMGMTRW